MTVYGDGFGRTYEREVPSSEETSLYGRREEVLTTIVGDKRVTVIVRNNIVPEDPYLNLVHAAAFVWYERKSGGRGRFPAPPVQRDIKDFLIRSNLII